MAINLTQLPAPTVIEVLDYETLLSQRKQQLLAALPVALREAVAATLALDSEPLTALLQENAYRELLLRQRINEAAQAVLLAYAKDADLDVLCANLNTRRQRLQQADASAQPPKVELWENDDDLRARAQLAFEGLSVAGPRAAYISHALSADGQVADVTATSPAPCEVLVSVLSRQGDGTASVALLNAVRTALNDDNVRPVGDRVTVHSAAIVPYTVAATLYLYPGPEAELIRAAAGHSLQRYLTQQRRLGRDIRRSALFAALHVEGVQRVELSQPAADLVLAGHQAAYCTASQIDIGGTDD